MVLVLCRFIISDLVRKVGEKKVNLSFLLKGISLGLPAAKQRWIVNL